MVATYKQRYKVETDMTYCLPFLLLTGNLFFRFICHVTYFIHLFYCKQEQDVKSRERAESWRMLSDWNAYCLQTWKKWFVVYLDYSFITSWWPNYIKLMLVELDILGIQFLHSFHHSTHLSNDLVGGNYWNALET